MKKRALSLFLALLMIVTMVPVEAFAIEGDFVAQIGESKFVSLAEAIAAVPTDGTETTITMLTDETIPGNAGVTIDSGKNIVLDLNGCTIKNLVNESKASQVINNKGTLTIKDSTDTNKDGTGNGLLTNDVQEGTVAGDWFATPQANYVTNVIGNNGTLIVESGAIVNTAGGSICYAVDNNSAGGYEISCTINGGLLKNVNYTPVRVAPTNTRSVTFVMNDGIIEGAYGIALNCNSQTAPNVSFTISGGTVKAKDYAFYTSASNNVSDTTKAEIAITGGTFGDGEVTTGEELISVSPFTEFISGGTYTEDPSDYLAPDYEIVANENGTFGVEAIKVAAIGDTKYVSLQEALDAAAAATDATKTVVLISDVTTEEALTVNMTNRN